MPRLLEFVSTEFPAYPGEEEKINPGCFGQRLAEFLRDNLPQHGFKPTTIYCEDWGWVVEIENESFRLWIGCGNRDDSENRFIAFIEPAKPYVWRLFRKIETAPVTERLAQALEAVITQSGKATEIRWEDG